VVLFHAFTEKKGFKSWDVGKKVVSIRSNVHAKSEPNLLVRRVFFPTIVLDWLQAIRQEWLQDPKSLHLIQ
jgi:hypothetical protein